MIGLALEYFVPVFLILLPLLRDAAVRVKNNYCEASIKYEPYCTGFYVQGKPL